MSAGRSLLGTVAASISPSFPAFSACWHYVTGPNLREPCQFQSLTSSFTGWNETCSWIYSQDHMIYRSAVTHYWWWLKWWHRSLGGQNKTRTFGLWVRNVSGEGRINRRIVKHDHGSMMSETSLIPQVMQKPTKYNRQHVVSKISEILEENVMLSVRNHWWTFQ